MKRPYVVIFVLILTLALTAALLSACNDKHIHTADVVCTVSEREVLLTYSCSCGATASSLTAEFTGRTGETVTLSPDRGQARRHRALRDGRRFQALSL